MTATPLSAWTYLRVSTADQVDGTSLDTQRQQCRDEIARRGWTLTQEVTDKGVSGAKASRPGLDRLVEACRRGEVDAVVVAKLDRLGRSHRQLVNLLGELDDLGITFVSVSEGLDSSGMTGQIMRSILAIMAQAERERIMERMVEGLRSVTAQGYWPGGPPPYGYRIIDDPDGSGHKKLAINDDEAALLRRVAHLIVNHGETAYSIAPQLNAEGIRTRRGSLWRHPNLSWQLRQPHLTGTWIYNQGGDPIEVEIPAIFTEAEWQQLQANIKGRPRSQRKSRVYALTGREPRKYLYCSCGGGYFGKTDTSKKGRAYYQCSRDNKSFGGDRCPHYPRNIQTPVLDKLVWDQFTAKLLDEDYLTHLAADFIPIVTDEAGDGVATEQRSLAIKLDKNRTAQKALIRQMAESDALDTMDEVLADLRDEEATLRSQVADLDHRLALAARRDSIPDQISTLVARAKDRLANPTPELMSEVFHEHRLHLTRVSGTRFEGTASIPLFHDGEGGEVSEEGPPLPALLPPRSGRGAWRGRASPGRAG